MTIATIVSRCRWRHAGGVDFYLKTWPFISVKRVRDTTDYGRVVNKTEKINVSPKRSRLSAHNSRVQCFVRNRIYSPRRIVQREWDVTLLSCFSSLAKHTVDTIEPPTTTVQKRFIFRSDRPLGFRPTGSIVAKSERIRRFNGIMYRMSRDVKKRRFLRFGGTSRLTYDRRGSSVEIRVTAEFKIIIYRSPD